MHLMAGMILTDDNPKFLGQWLGLPSTFFNQSREKLRQLPLERFRLFFWTIFLRVKKQRVCSQEKLNKEVFLRGYL